MAKIKLTEAKSSQVWWQKSSVSNGGKDQIDQGQILASMVAKIKLTKAESSQVWWPRPSWPRPNPRKYGGQDQVDQCRILVKYGGQDLDSANAIDM